MNETIVHMMQIGYKKHISFTSFTHYRAPCNALLLTQRPCSNCFITPSTNHHALYQGLIMRSLNHHALSIRNTNKDDTTRYADLFDLHASKNVDLSDLGTRSE